MEFRKHAEKYHLCFYKNSANEIFTFISSKLVYFNKHLACIALLGNKVSTAINYSISPANNYACSRSNAGVTPNILKDLLRNVLLGCISKYS